MISVQESSINKQRKHWAMSILRKQSG